MKKYNQPKRLVLYADDDRDDRHFVRTALFSREADIELKTFPNAIALLQFILDQDEDEPLPCLIILDVNMPQMNGKEALKNLRSFKKYKDVPVILFSTSTLPSDFLFAEDHKAAFFTKPLNENQMEIIIEKFLEHCKENAKT